MTKKLGDIFFLFLLKYEICITEEEGRKDIPEISFISLADIEEAIALINGTN